MIILYHQYYCIVKFFRKNLLQTLRRVIEERLKFLKNIHYAVISVECLT